MIECRIQIRFVFTLVLFIYPVTCGYGSFLSHFLFNPLYIYSKLTPPVSSHQWSEWSGLSWSWFGLDRQDLVWFEDILKP